MKQFQSSKWQKDLIHIRAGELCTLDFQRSNPNMFMLQNPNAGKVKVGITHIPTTSRWEYIVSANSCDTFGQPIGTNKLYLLNDSGIDITIHVFSNEMEFDMSVLKGFNFNFDGQMDVSTDGMVNGFKAGVMLPSGNNRLGSVNLSANIEEAILENTQTNIEALDTLQTVTEKIKDLNMNLSDVEENTALLYDVKKLLERQNADGSTLSPIMYAEKFYRNYTLITDNFPVFEEDIYVYLPEYTQTDIYVRLEEISTNVTICVERTERNLINILLEGNYMQGFNCSEDFEDYVPISTFKEIYDFIVENKNLFWDGEYTPSNNRFYIPNTYSNVYHYMTDEKYKTGLLINNNTAIKKIVEFVDNGVIDSQGNFNVVSPLTFAVENLQSHELILANKLIQCCNNSDISIKLNIIDINNSNMTIEVLPHSTVSNLVINIKEMHIMANGSAKGSIALGKF